VAQLTARAVPTCWYHAVDRDLDRLGRTQHGILSFDDLLMHGVIHEGISRRARTNSLIRVYPGIYRMPGAPATWQQALWAAKKWAGDDCVFSHRSGLLLLGLAGATDRVVEMTVTRRIRSPSRRLLLHYTRRDPFVGAIEINGLPVTSAGRAVLDSAAVARKWQVEAALDDALRRKLFTVDDMWRILARSGGRGRKGSALLRALLEERSDGRARSHSLLEIKLDGVLRNSAVPAYFRQFEVMTKSGVPADVDFAWPEAKLAVEVDGYRWHAGRRQWQSDLDRQNALAEVGWLVLRFTWYDVVSRPEYVVRTILEAYRQRVA
jgi:very-short-patch-repair endonuclease